MFLRNIVTLLVVTIVSARDLSKQPDDGFIREPGRCVAYDICDEAGALPCVDNRLAQPLLSDDEAVDAATLELLDELCPHLSGQNTFCCSASQLQVLDKEMRKPGNFISGCQNCFTNYKALFCDIVCNANQSMFLNVTQTSTLAVGNKEEAQATTKLSSTTESESESKIGSESESESRPYVTKFTYFLSEQYASMVHQSCVETSYLICGNFWNACTQDQLYSYLGDNAFTVLKTDYVITDDDVSPFQPGPTNHLTACHEGRGRCACKDCPASCDNKPTNCSKPTIPNATVSPATDIIFSGEKYTVACNRGYTLSGDKELTCAKNGTLSAHPTCLIADCTGLPSPWRSVITDTVFPVKQGTVVRVRCTAGHSRLSGDEEIVCEGGTRFSYVNKLLCKQADDVVVDSTTWCSGTHSQGWTGNCERITVQVDISGCRFSETPQVIPTLSSRQNLQAGYIRSVNSTAFTYVLPTYVFCKQYDVQSGYMSELADRDVAVSWVAVHH